MNKVFLLVAVFACAAVADCSDDFGDMCLDASCDADASLTTTLAELESATCQSFIKTAVDGQCFAFQKCLDDVEAKKFADKLAAVCPEEKAGCKDSDATFCPVWANSSQCTENPDWMLVNCQNSCCPICTGSADLLKTGVCPGKDREDLCVANLNGSSDECDAWSLQGECDKNPVWMTNNCMQSCCETCKKDKDGCPTTKAGCQNLYAAELAPITFEQRDAETIKTRNAQCVTWATLDTMECTKNPTFMIPNCGNECCTLCKPKPPVQTPAPAVPTPAPLVFNNGFNQPLNFGGFGNFGGYTNQGFNNFNQGFNNFGSLPYRG